MKWLWQVVDPGIALAVIIFLMGVLFGVTGCLIGYG